MSQNVVLVSTLQDLKSFWKSVVLKLNKTKTIFLFEGDIGSGKTTSVGLIYHLMQECDSSTVVSSPSFALHQQYILKNHPVFDTIDHIDLYRIQSEEELESTGFWDILTGDRKLIIIEWPSRFDQKMLPLGAEIYKFTWRINARGERQILWRDSV